MKDGFFIKIETIHVPNDIGKQENVSHQLICVLILEPGCKAYMYLWCIVMVRDI